MKQVAKQISIYAADVSGVASAMFELGGMTVIHDPSGCNSTYNTHDETRWYDHDSFIFISALTERDAAMGNDAKLIDDICEAAEKFAPSFISICGTPVPFMMGTDLNGIAAAVEKRTGIPAFGMKTNNMHAYFVGAGEAFGNIARRLVKEPDGAKTPDGIKVSPKRINVLGVTPLDFSAEHAGEKFRRRYEDMGYEVISVWAMDSSLDELLCAGKADVNAVVSSAGLEPAKVLKERFGIPYIVGLPGVEYAGAVDEAARESDLHNAVTKAAAPPPDDQSPDIIFLGEAVQNVSLAILTENASRAAGQSLSTRVISPLDTPHELLRPGDIRAEDETEIMPHIEGSKLIVADPLYKSLCPAGAAFYPLPHHGFSGRMFNYGNKKAPDLTGDTDSIIRELLKKADDFLK